MRISTALRAGVLGGALSVACSKSDTTTHDDYAGIMAFDSATIRLIGRDTNRLDVELAESEPQHTMGLMERRSLAPSAGMLFVYPSTQPDSSAFWMYRTRIPLDIAFIDSAGTIRTILTMQPCPSELAQGCPSYPANAPYVAALETNAGYFAAHALRVGDRVLLSDTSSRRAVIKPPR
jgi:uncharacterized membrane protein (UPF0127 family)